MVLGGPELRRGPIRIKGGHPLERLSQENAHTQHPNHFLSGFQMIMLNLPELSGQLQAAL